MSIEKLQRYSAGVGGGAGTVWPVVKPDDKGRLVYLSDLRAREDALLAELKRMLEPGACPKAALDLIRQIETTR